MNVSEKNRTICTLLNIYDKGIDHNTEVPTAHRKDFKDLFKQMEHIPTGTAEGDEQRGSIRGNPRLWPVACCGRNTASPSTIRPSAPQSPGRSRRNKTEKQSKNPPLTRSFMPTQDYHQLTTCFYVVEDGRTTWPGRYTSPSISHRLRPADCASERSPVPAPRTRKRLKGRLHSGRLRYRPL
ncbi:MAG: hypothetical protein ACLR8Y_10705 [Alistipes indistinctus]